jgi:hypothetical protein
MVAEPPCCQGLAFIAGNHRDFNQAAETVFLTEKTIEKRFQPLTQKIRAVSKFVNAIF